MRSVFFISLFLLLCLFSRAQSLSFANKLIEYWPAPGQHINDPATGTPSTALEIINGIGGPLSLGAFGGYVVLGFSSGISNHPDNPYGVDFIIYGNATATHSEPGIVKVMKDENGNGLPDDTWYEIAGSVHFTKDYEQGYSIYYLNPKNPFAADVPWTDNEGNSGKVYKNSFHTQPFYPMSEFFPGISNESQSYHSSKINGKVKTQNGIYVSLPFAFGYADNVPVKNQEIAGIPDNPYTLESIEGDGGDAFDISWAVDNDGNYVDLPEVNFVMITTGINESAGWLGEISTDIRGIADVAPDKNIKGPLKMILPSEIPVKIAISDSLVLSGRVFVSGRPAKDKRILWESLDPAFVQIADNVLVAKGTGVAEIRCSLVSDPAVFSISKISVVVPVSLVLDTQKRQLQEGEKLTVNYSIIDNSGESVSGLIPEIIIENSEVAEVTGISSDQVIINAKAKGTSLISFNFPDYPQLTGTFEIQVLRKIEPIEVTFSLSNEEKTILPRMSYKAGKADFLSLTKRYQKNFQTDKPYITLADVITSVLKSEGFSNEGKSIEFRQDEFGGDGLYVWQIGFDWEYRYGWGGSIKDATYAKTWVAIVNNNIFVSGFDTIEIFNNDRISLRHIEDIRDSWSFIRIIPEKKEIAIGETINFRAEQIDVFPDDNNDFMVSGPFPVVNASVIVDQSVIYNESDLFTSYSGEFRLSFNRSGNYEVAVEKSESVVVEVLFPLSIPESEHFSFYPNPSNNSVTINNSSGEITAIKIFSMDGSLKLNMQTGCGFSSMDLNLSNLEKGVYILELISNGKSIKQKLCKL
jgi:hypothetical protein